MSDTFSDGTPIPDGWDQAPLDTDDPLYRKGYREGMEEAAIIAYQYGNSGVGLERMLAADDICQAIRDKAKEQDDGRS